MRRLAALTALLCACGSKPPPPAAPLTTEGRIRSATESFLQCLARQGPQCVDPHPAIDAWLALGQLGMLDHVPGPLVADRLIQAARYIDSPEWFRKAMRETRTAARRAEDLSCRPGAIRQVSAAYHARGKRLIRAAERLGLASTAASRPTGKLAAELRGFDNVRIVDVQCKKGPVFVLVGAPRKTIDPDEDPRAHPSGGWEAVMASPDLTRLQTGAPEPARPAPAVIDRSPKDVIDPWIPLTELDI